MRTEDYTYSRFNEDTVNEYGMGEKDERGYYSMRLFKFQLQPSKRIDIEDDDTKLSIQKLKQAVSGFFDMYIKFVTAYMQVHEIYKPFLTKYFHQREAFPTESESAQYFEDSNKSGSKTLKR